MSIDKDSRPDYNMKDHNDTNNLVDSHESRNSNYDNKTYTVDDNNDSNNNHIGKKKANAIHIEDLAKGDKGHSEWEALSLNKNQYEYYHRPRSLTPTRDSGQRARHPRESKSCGERSENVTKETAELGTGQRKDDELIKYSGSGGMEDGGASSSLSLATPNGLHWLRQMILGKTLVSAQATIMMSEGRGAAIALFRDLGKNGRVGALKDLARQCGATLKIVSKGKSAWAAVGPSDGGRIEYNATSEMLKVTLKRKATSGTCTMQAVSEVTRLSNGDIDDDPSDTVVPIEQTRRVYIPAHSRPLFERDTLVQELIARCREWDGSSYPPPGVNECFAGALAKIKIERSDIHGKGSFVRGKIVKGEAFGFYEGVVTENRGSYVMTVFDGSSKQRNVDANPNVLGYDSIHGSINEDLFRGIPNAEVRPSGLFIALRDIEDEEVVINYTSHYDWSELKQKVFSSLSRHLARDIPEMWAWIPKSWSEAKESRDHISKWLVKVVEGRADQGANPLHSSSNASPLPPKDRLVRLITFGPFTRKFNFRLWEREQRVWPDIPFASSGRKRFSTCWNCEQTMDIQFVDLFKDNGNFRTMAMQIRGMDRPRFNPTLKEDPRVSVRAGVLRIGIRIPQRGLSSKLQRINACRNREQLRAVLETEKMWRVSYINDPADDNYPGGGWCGYLAMDQLRRKRSHPVDLTTGSGRLEMIETLKELVMRGQGDFRVNWKSLPRGALKYPKEIILSVIESLEQARSFLSTRTLELERWLPTKVISGLCLGYGFSRWSLDPEDEDFNVMDEGPYTKGGITDKSEWIKILSEPMMTLRNHHYHVRDSGWAVLFQRGTELAIDRLSLLLGMQGQEDVRLGTNSMVDVTSGITTGVLGTSSLKAEGRVSTEPDSQLNPPSISRRSSGGSEAVGALGPVPIQGSKPADITEEELRSVVKGVLEEMIYKAAGVEESKPAVIGRHSTQEAFTDLARGGSDAEEERPRDADKATLDEMTSRVVGAHAPKQVAGEVVDVGSRAKLKVVFWNSNCWNSMNCEKIAEVAKSNNADVICVTDARMDPGKARYMNGYLATLKKSTGKIWRGKFEARPARGTKCFVGGDIIFFSEKCSKVVKDPLLPYGTVSALRLVWEKTPMKIVSVYKPYKSNEDSEGSLIKAVSKLVPEYEESFWDEVLSDSSVPTLIGGDFNMGVEAVSDKAVGSQFSLSHYGERASTFRRISDCSKRVVTIDHVLSNRGGAEAWVAEDGLFLDDHFPVVGSILADGLPATEGKKIQIRLPPTIRASDKGALRKLTESLARRFSGDLSACSVKTITNWTVAEAQRIAKSRNTKHNPDGWSPASRILHIKLRALGALFKRMADGSGLGACYKLYKDARRDINNIELNDDEREWFGGQGVEISLPSWRQWQLENTVDSLRAELAALKELTSKERRSELRILHGGRMRRIQDQADAGKIGAIIRNIMAKSKAFSLEVLYGEEGNITDADEISKIVTEFFKEWFDTSPEDELRDGDVAEFSASTKIDEWKRLASKLNIKWEVAKEVLEGMADKPISVEGRAEAAELERYCPSLEEFNSYISKLNPRSAGGPSGLTYLLVQQWPENVRSRVHAALSSAWKKREAVPGWGLRWLQPIPKIQDPGLEDLRPLMLVEVTRKIWVGLIMARIAKFWKDNGLIDDAQHAYIRGKGTHTAISQLTNCIESARGGKTSMYISSWDMRRAFDSLGRKFIIRSLMRLHIPAGLAAFMTSLDVGGYVFVKTPKNMRIAERGLDSLEYEGDKFETRKGTGQGDIPSPLLWVAALDTLLATMRRRKSEFKTLDLSGQSHSAETIAFADDVLSIEATLEALQMKADIISAWCILTGIEISYTKLRSFGVHWGVWRKDLPLIVHAKNWAPREIKLLSDGSLKHLGLKSDMDGSHTIQKTECEGKIKELGETVMGAIARSRDRCTAIGYCVRTNVTYRAQHSSWTLKDYKDVDAKFLSLVKRATLNMMSFPSRLLTSYRKHGGLGIISITEAAHERKRKMLLGLINKSGADGVAMQGLVVNALKSSGQGEGGLGETQLWPSLNEDGMLDSLVRKLKDIGLRLKVGNDSEERAMSAAKGEEDDEERIELNRRGVALEAELIEGGEVQVRIGQCWKLGNRLIEVVAFNGPDIEFIEWETQIVDEAPRQGGLIYVSARDDYYGYPTGMGSRQLMSYALLSEGASHLVEMGTDWFGEIEGNQVLQSRVMCIRSKKMTRFQLLPSSGDWAKWPGGNFLHIYTDGSHAEDKTLAQFFLGESNRITGGAIILSDGVAWVHRLFVDIDVEVSSAFDVELICILIANEMSVAKGGRVVIHSDCMAAIKTANGGYSEGFFNTLNAWKKGEEVEVVKVRAHPERFKHHSEWDWDDRGIWTADRVAGRAMEYEGRVSAAEWLKRIGRRSLLVIEESDGTPFIGSVRERASKMNMKKYWEERDGWRVKDGLDPKWAGTNINMAFGLLWRNGGLEDHATMLRLCSDKRWEHSRHNLVVCKACKGEFRGLRHPLLQCCNLQLGIARKHWKSECYAHAEKQSSIAIKATLLEVLHHAFNTKGGEHACLGAFIPYWVSNVSDGRLKTQVELRSVKKMLRVLSSGARLVMREYARLKEVAEGDARELRQLSINSFVKVGRTAPKAKPKIRVCDTHANAPPDSVWGSGDSSANCKLRWIPRVASRLDPEATSFIPCPPEGQRPSSLAAD